MGGFLTGFLFQIPGFVIMVLFAWLYRWATTEQKAQGLKGEAVVVRNYLNLIALTYLAANLN
jgi:hypothetical protein